MREFTSLCYSRQDHASVDLITIITMKEVIMSKRKLSMVLKCRICLYGRDMLKHGRLWG